MLSLRSICCDKTSFILLFTKVVMTLTAAPVDLSQTSHSIHSIEFSRRGCWHGYAGRTVVSVPHDFHSVICLSHSSQ